MVADISLTIIRIKMLKNILNLIRNHLMEAKNMFLIIQMLWKKLTKILKFKQMETVMQMGHQMVIIK